MRTLYPPLEPYHAGCMVSGLHQIHLEECGNPAGIPVLFLHGGPGSGCRPDHRRFFDPSRYRIVLVDQRGAGRSLPQGELRENTTGHLLDDLEYIRRQLDIDRWVLFGGSWGAALALLYAQAHPERVLGMILRGSFLARRQDVQWFVETGAPRIYPEQWSQWLESLPETERRKPIAALDRLLNGRDELAQRRAAREWTLWSNRVALADAFDPDGLSDHIPLSALHQARIEIRYARQGYFIEEGQVLRDCDPRFDAIPLVLVHGRRDLVCPVEAAFALSRKLPHAALRILPNAGHLAAGDEMVDALVTATDQMAALLGSAH